MSTLARRPRIGRRARVVFVVVAAAAAVGAGSVAWAQIGTGGVISGCLSRTGFIRGIDEATNTCREGETAVSWYTKGGSDAAFLTREGKAANSELLDGVDSTAFAAVGHDHDGRYAPRAEADARYLAAGGTAADSERLDGKDAADFVQGAGAVVGGFESIVVGDPARSRTIPGFGTLAFGCEPTPNLREARVALLSSAGPLEHLVYTRTDGATKTTDEVKTVDPKEPGALLGPVSGTYLVQATAADGPTLTVTGTVWYDGKNCNVHFFAVVAS